MTIGCRYIVPLLVLTFALCLVESRPVNDDSNLECEPGYMRFDRDCIRIKLIKELRRLLCELTKNMNPDSGLFELRTFCGSGLRDEETRHWGNGAMGKRVWGNGGMKRDELLNGEDVDKRAWWHTGLKPGGSRR